MSVQTFTSTGNKATSAVKLDKSIFGLDVTSHELIKQVYVAYLANGRGNLAQTQSRGEVSGGGKKPWRQKGTGRARFGSSRNPIWRGGGVAFGPTGEENYSQKLNVKAKRQATRQALSLANKANKISIIEKIDAKDGKTSLLVKLLSKIGANGSTLLIVEDKTDMVKRATKNIPGLTLVQAQYVNVYDVMNADNVVITQKALNTVHEWLGATKKTAKEGEA